MRPPLQKWTDLVFGILLLTSLSSHSQQLSKLASGVYDGNYVVYQSAIYYLDGARFLKILPQNDSIVILKTLRNSDGKSQIIEYEGILYFAANDGVNGNELWRSDGSIAGTYMVKNIDASSFSSNPNNFFIFKDELYFWVRRDGFDREVIWKTNGDANSTVKVLNTYAFFSQLSPSFQFNLPTVHYDFSFVFNNKLYFLLSLNQGNFQMALFETDGTQNGTKRIADFNSRAPVRFLQLKGKMLLIFEDGVRELNSMGVLQMIQQMPYTRNIKRVFPAENHLYYTSVDATTFSQTGDLIKTDGTANGERRVLQNARDINFFFPQDPTTKNLYLTYNTIANGYKLYVLNMLTDQISLVTDVSSEQSPSIITGGYRVNLPAGIALDNNFYFGGILGNNSSLWRAGNITRTAQSITISNGRFSRNFFTHQNYIFCEQHADGNAFGDLKLLNPNAPLPSISIEAFPKLFCSNSYDLKININYSPKNDNEFIVYAILNDNPTTLPIEIGRGKGTIITVTPALLTIGRKYSLFVRGSNPEAESARNTTFDVQAVPTAAMSYDRNQIFLPVVLTANTGNQLSYQWIFNQQDIKGTNESKYTATENGRYQVRVSDANGCMRTSLVTVINLQTPLSIGQSGVEINPITVFPNPFGETIKAKIVIDKPSKVELKLIDMNGRTLRTLVENEELLTGEYFYEWNIEKCYHCQIVFKQNNEQKLLKIYKNH